MIIVQFLKKKNDDLNYNIINNRIGSSLKHNVLVSSIKSYRTELNWQLGFRCRKTRTHTGIEFGRSHYDYEHKNNNNNNNVILRKKIYTEF